MSKFTWGLCMALAVLPTVASAGVDEMLDQAAQRHSIPAELVHAVAMVESTKTCGVKSGGSIGIMQVTRGAAKEVGVKWPFRSCEDEIEAGVRYLKLALDKGGYGCSGISLYNTGLSAKPRCTAYGQKVMKARKNYP
jgi:soluble lytic murein transglycosylase-like protein